MNEELTELLTSALSAHDRHDPPEYADRLWADVERIAATPTAKVEADPEVRVLAGPQPSAPGRTRLASAAAIVVAVGLGAIYWGSSERDIEVSTTPPSPDACDEVEMGDDLPSAAAVSALLTSGSGWEQTEMSALRALRSVLIQLELETTSSVDPDRLERTRAIAATRLEEAVATSKAIANCLGR